jgi:hypothetical protein
VFPSAQGFNYVNFLGGLSYMVTTQEEAAPSPLVNSLGLGLKFSLGNWIVLKAGIQGFGNYYGFTSNGDGRLIPIEYELRDFWVLSSILDLKVGLNIPMGKVFGITGAVGPAFVLRFPFASFPDMVSKQDQATSYFFSGTRYVYLESDVAFDWQISEKMGVSFGIRFFYPIFTLWNGEEVAFPDQSIFTGLICFNRKLG